MPSIDRSSTTPFYLQVYEQIAQGIERGVYPAGKKLPSIRECARELDVSNTTIELAYQKLTEEGFVTARRGSGYVICTPSAQPVASGKEFTDGYLHALDELDSSASARRDSDSYIRYDFAYDQVDMSTFPFTTWARISRDVLFSKGMEAACLYNDRQGLPELREEISHYVSSEYGVTCTAEQILVMPTTRDVISNIMALFDPMTTSVAMEEPGYDEVADKLVKSGYRVKPIPMLPFPSVKEAKRHLRGAGLVFATPACQFPTNMPMPLDQRRELVSWAEEHDAYLIDDEYGWEFQTGAQRSPSLAALDRSGQVITLGTFSNSFTPAVCLSYAVLPPQLMIKWLATWGDAHPQVPWQTQAAMAMFMREGHWRTHVRKIRTSMNAKRAALRSAIEMHLGDAVEVREGTSNLFMLVQTADGRDEDELVSSAEQAGVRVYPTRRYWRDEAPASWRYVLVGFAGIDSDDIEPGVQALAKAWFPDN